MPTCSALSGARATVTSLLPPRCAPATTTPTWRPRRSSAAPKPGQTERSVRCAGSAIACNVSLAAVRFEHVLVVGAGQMGGGIAQVVAGSGRRVSLHDSLPGATDRALSTMEKSLLKLAEKGGAPPSEVLARVQPVDALVPADLMIEA